uniref:Uncharacterized protein n=1 Tax=Hippocampus comes TaxID=109280 RepID=A0A3Q2XIT9_HIPCM
LHHGRAPLRLFGAATSLRCTSRISSPSSSLEDGSNMLLSLGRRRHLLGYNSTTSRGGRFTASEREKERWGRIPWGDEKMLLLPQIGGEKKTAVKRRKKN